MQLIAKHYGMLVFVITMWYRGKKVQRRFGKSTHPDIPPYLTTEQRRRSKAAEDIALLVLLLTALALVSVIFYALFLTNFSAGTGE